jgi:hypothetical protein
VCVYILDKYRAGQRLDLVLGLMPAAVCTRERVRE